MFELLDCMTRGVRAASASAKIVLAPMADGGEGFTRVLVTLTGGELHDVMVCGPLGRRVKAQIGCLGGRHRGTVAIEIASAAGIRLVPQGRRNPLRTTSYGVGELIGAALDRGARRLLIGCGDSGVNDGGAGMAQALGARMLDENGREIARGGCGLLALARIDASNLDPRLQRVPVVASVNWSNRLLGPRSVARVYGPQKGASASDVHELEKGLRRYATVLRRDLGVDVRDMAGAGASGGLGAGLHAFLRARLMPRFDVLSEFFDFNAVLRRADLVVTAEGSLDARTAFGKLPGEVARRAREAGVPTIALVGSVGEGAETLHAIGIDAYFSILNAPVSLADAMRQAPDLVAQATEQAVRLALLDCRRGK